MRYSTYTGMSPSSRQHGAALIIGLVLLISLTVVGIGVLSTTSLEQRMAGNMADLNLAFNAAESVSRQFMVQSVNTLGPIERVCKTINANPCLTTDQDDNWWDTATASDWSGMAVTAKNFFVPIKGVKTQPMLVVEIERRNYFTQVRGFDYQTPGIDFIRLTSRGTGASDNTEVVLQQTITKQ